MGAADGELGGEHDGEQACGGGGVVDGDVDEAGGGEDADVHRFRAWPGDNQDANKATKRRQTAGAGQPLA